MKGADPKFDSVGHWFAGLYFVQLSQATIGFLISYLYHTEDPGQSIWMLRSSRAGRVFLDLHSWGSTVLLLGWAFLIAFLIFRGKFRGGDRHLYWSSVVLGLAAYIQQVTGNLLPMDRHDVQTVVVEAGVAGGVPHLGPWLKATMLAGPQLSMATVALWYLVHALCTFTLLAPWLLKKLLRVDARMSTSPWMGMGLGALIVALALALGAPTGGRSSAADYQAYDALPSWYDLPLHGTLRMLSTVSLGWLGLAIPVLLVACLLVAPWLGASRPRRVQVPLSLLVGVLVVGTIGWGGQFALPWGRQNPTTDMLVNPFFPESETPLVAKGQDLFLAKGCINCHIAGGKGGGPDLAKIGDRRDTKWIKEFIANPTSQRPGSTMPAFDRLSQDELEALAEFLVWLR